MNFGVIGPGNIGEVIVSKLRDAGYPVKMANSRGPESLKYLGAKTGSEKLRETKIHHDRRLVERSSATGIAFLVDREKLLRAVAFDWPAS